MSLGAELGGSVRNISGDIHEDDSLRVALRGPKELWFYGIQDGTTIAVNKITAAIQVYHYWPSYVRGVGGWRLIAGLSIASDLFSYRTPPQDR